VEERGKPKGREFAAIRKTEGNVGHGSMGLGETAVGGVALQKKGTVSRGQRGGGRIGRKKKNQKRCGEIDKKKRA